MKFRCVRIEPDLSNKEWRVSVINDPQEREDVQTLPNPNGFFWFSERISEAEAIEMLVKEMMKSHAEAIDRLTKSMGKLNAILRSNV